MPHREVSSRANEVEEIAIMLQVLCSLPKRPLSFWFNQHLHGFTTNSTRLWAGCREDGARQKRRGAKARQRGTKSEDWPALGSRCLRRGDEDHAQPTRRSARTAQASSRERKSVTMWRTQAQALDGTCALNLKATYLGKTKHYNGQHGESIRLKKEQALRVKAQKVANSG